jgi:hypothetical protein
MKHGPALSLKVFQNNVLKRIFWFKREEFKGELKKLRKEGYKLCTIPQMILRG